MITFEYWEMLRWFRDQHPEMLGRYLDSVSPDQYSNKRWLVEELVNNIKYKKKYWKEDAVTIEIIGGWFGFPLIQILKEEFDKIDLKIKLIRVVELDPFCNSVIEKYKELFDIDLNIKFVNEDINNIQEHKETRETRIVINTSCEHMNDMKEIILKRGYNTDKVVFAIQSNNKTDEPDHINCVEDVDSLRDQCSLICSYKGEKDWGKYKRYTVIGKYEPNHIYTFMWGNKYGPEYANRLYGAVKRNCKQHFVFTCITDNTEGLRPEIEIIDYDTFDPFDHDKDRIFTREKGVLMERSQYSMNVILDLDLLIHGDITPLVTTEKTKPTFIWNHWNWDSRTESERIRWYGKGVNCFVNSSFVAWTGKSAGFIFDHISLFEEEAFHTYKSYDKYLYYQHVPKGHLDFWPKGYFYNYNFESEDKYVYQENKVACLFNTSHIAKNRLKVDAFELDEAQGWVKDLWESYDRDS